jgi:hypothetical protein
LLIPILYFITLARTLVLGDPTEYTFIANTLGIAHPSGYAFITVVGKLFQTLIPIGEYSLANALCCRPRSATLASFFVFDTIKNVCNQQTVIRVNGKPLGFKYLLPPFLGRW